MRHVHSDERIRASEGRVAVRAVHAKELAALARLATPVVVEQGRVLAKEGTAGQEFVVVVDGVASATVNGEEIGQVGPGSFFGDLALLDAGPRTATVRADTPMLVLVLDRSEFNSLVDRAIPSVGRRMLVTLAERLRAERLRAEGLRKADARVTSNAERLSEL